MAKAGSISKLKELHSKLTELFLMEIQFSIDENIPMAAADKNAIISFLKNNDITAEASEDSLAELREEFKECSAELQAKTERLFQEAQDMNAHDLLS